jgi:hypothetical protein
MVDEEKSDGHLEQRTRQIHRGNCFAYARSVDVRNIVAQLHNNRDKQHAENKLAKREYPAEMKHSAGRFGVLHEPESLHDMFRVGRGLVFSIERPCSGMGERYALADHGRVGHPPGKHILFLSGSCCKSFDERLGYLRHYNPLPFNDLI